MSTAATLTDAVVMLGDALAACVLAACDAHDTLDVLTLDAHHTARGTAVLALLDDAATADVRRILADVVRETATAHTAAERMVTMQRHRMARGERVARSHAFGAATRARLGVRHAARLLGMVPD